MKALAVRLRPGQELRARLDELIAGHSIKAGFIITCVGSLEKVVLRMPGAKPNKQDIRTYEGDFEITSLVGTIGQSGCHLHMSFSDENGKVLGGHLKEAFVKTTAELVVGIDGSAEYRRILDKETGFKELEVI